ncbi:MAG: 3-deoxy-7-phosphoheptulonate synthase [Oligoflexales bacterium]
MLEKSKNFLNIKGLSWRLDSWRRYEALQQPSYPCSETLLKVREELRSSPSLVDVESVRRLKAWFLKAQKGQAFILQGGDCAEDFSKNSVAYVHGQCQLLTQLAETLEQYLPHPVVKIGRIAGQYGKPRTLDKELNPKTGEQQWAFRGHNINSEKSCVLARTPDPERMLEGYKGSLKAMQWIAEFLEENAEPLAQSEIFTSHEGLLLDLESAQTKYNTQDQVHYNQSSHMQWIGERTRHLGGAHIEYFRGVGNPIGLKVGADSNPSDIVETIMRLNPYYHSGRIMLITRMGAQKVRVALPALIEKVQQAHLPVLWSCDPMHGNGQVNAMGVKTRVFEDLWSELKSCFDIHQEMDSHLSGVHLEMTHEPVTECVKQQEIVLAPDYRSLCDPRLNALQAQNLVNCFVDHYQDDRRHSLYQARKIQASHGSSILNI